MFSQSKLMVFVGVSVVAFWAASASAVQRYVDVSVGSGGNGQSWAQAYNDLQDAINNSYAGDEILVAQGTYSPGSTQSATFNISERKIRGGYAGSLYPDPGARDIENYVTILSGDVNGDDGPYWQNRSDNNYNVVSCTVSSQTELDGCRVVGGYADNYYESSGYGGGLDCTITNGTLSIRDCTFDGNYAYCGGGAARFYAPASAGSLVIENCIFSANRTDTCGGALYVADPCYVYVSNSSFLSNVTGGNSNYYGGGAIYMSSDYPHVEGCFFQSNCTYGAGGAIWNVHGDGDIKNTRFINNVSYKNGGAICHQADAYNTTSLSVFDSLFKHNGGDGHGGGIYCGGPDSGSECCYLNTDNCTFTDNYAYPWGGRGGGVARGPGYYSHVIVTHRNSLFWGNTDSGTDLTVAQIGLYYQLCTTLSYCWIQGLTAVDPRLDVDGYHLISDSQCRDAGDPAGSYGSRTDIDGEARLEGTLVDIGCDEFHTGRVCNQRTGVEYYSIQTAINDASSSVVDTLVAQPGTYGETINFGGKNVVLQSTNPGDWAVVENTIIDAGGTGSVVTFSAGQSAQISGFTITGGGYGGIVGNGCSASVTQCIIEGNNKDGPGAGIHGVGTLTGGGEIRQCIIRDNSGWSSGGLAACHGLIVNCLIADNTGLYRGGMANCDGEIVNCTIANNTATMQGATYVGGVYGCDGPYSSITNCIIWGNSPDQIEASSTPNYSCIQNWGTGGTENTNLDPLFMTGDYRLEYGSPCMDEGAEVGVNTDIDGEERLTNRRSGEGQFDIGAYECRVFDSGQKTPDGWTYDYVYYGHLHNHCGISDGDPPRPADEAYSTANENELDFFSLADHSSDDKFTPQSFASMKAAAETYNQSHVFTTFWGFEWSSNTYGHVAVTKAPDDVAMEYCNHESSDYDTFEELAEWLSAQDCVAFFNHPGRNNTSGLEFEHFTGAFSDKVVGMELWNKAELFSRFYYNDGYVTPNLTDREGYFDEALQNGWRIGAAGSQDHHGTTWGAEAAKVAIPANVNTREELYAALQARRFYSTLSKTVMLSFEVNGQPMGSCILPGESHCVIKAKDAAAGNFTKIELIHNGNIIKIWGSGDFIDAAHPVVEWDVAMERGDYLYCTVSKTLQPASNDAVAISSPVYANQFAATVPNPVNGSTGMATTVTLQTWVNDPTGEDGAVDVYFYGREKTEPSYYLIRSEASVPSDSKASIEWDGLWAETEYEWFVIVTEPVTVLSAHSPIWSFTTGSPIATEPSPADGLVLAPINAILSWTPGVDAVSHDVYFGTDPQPPLVSQQQSGTTYTPSLEYGTTYYWAVDEHSAGQVITQGPVWSFTTTPLYYMEGFESYSLGQRVGSHPAWYDGGNGPVVTGDIGVGDPESVGLAPANNIFTWVAYPFKWSEVDKVIVGMDFETDASGHLDDDRVGWMITDTSWQSSNFFGVQVDPIGSTTAYNIETYWKHGSSDVRLTIVNLPGLISGKWYRLRAEFTRLTDTSASIDAALWSLDDNGTPLQMVAGGSISDTSALGTGAPNTGYFDAATIWPAYKNYDTINGAADNAYFELVLP